MEYESPKIGTDPNFTETGVNWGGGGVSRIPFLIEIPSSVPPGGLSHRLFLASWTLQTSEHFP